jgi:DNA-binding NtrC family response regulator
MRKDSPVSFITSDPVMLSILDEMRRIAPYPVPVLITGESGTGKELVAGLIHGWSGRGGHPFVAVNSAALGGDLFESSLFGHVRGAFTGAVHRRAGFVEAADSGTLFLDEIGEAPPSAQSGLLRFLDSGEYIRVGEWATRRSGARVIAATNRDLETETAEGRFRKDLYFRLASIVFEIPPLRERRCDILSLARSFMEQAARSFQIPEAYLSRRAEEALESYDWPGNVRQLKNEITSAALRKAGGCIRPTDLSGCLTADRAGIPRGGRGLDSRIMRYERKELLDALRVSGSNCSRAAEILGLKRTTLLYRMRRHGIVIREDDR